MILPALAALAAQPVPPQPPELRPVSGGVVVEEKGQGFSFSYGWPGQVHSVPRLQSLLEKLRAEARNEAEPCVPQTDIPCPEIGFDYDTQWEWLGRGGALVSLMATPYAFTGGAHGNFHHEGLIWDDEAGRGIAPSELWGASWSHHFRERYCAELNREREARRGEPVDPNGPEFMTACPPLGEVVALPADEDGNGRFETMALALAPYAAGPYSEGSYGFGLPLRAADLALIPVKYRAAFESRP